MLQIYKELQLSAKTMNKENLMWLSWSQMDNQEQNFKCTVTLINWLTILKKLTMLLQHTQQKKKLIKFLLRKAWFLQYKVPTLEEFPQVKESKEVMVLAIFRYLEYKMRIMPMFNRSNIGHQQHSKKHYKMVKLKI
jgi:hypothetical protein